MEPCTFQLQLPKVFPKKPQLKKILIFFQKSPQFSGNKNPKEILMFQQTELFILQEVTFQDQKIFILFLTKMQNFLN